MKTIVRTPGSRKGYSKLISSFPVFFLGIVLSVLMTACIGSASREPGSSTTLPPRTAVDPTPLVFPREFHVQANAFVDQDGEPMVFRGMAAIDPVYQRFDESPDHAIWNENYYRVIAEWCANIIRLPILPSSVRRFGMEKTLDTLDQTIVWAAENNLYVIIDYHSLGWPPENYYPSDAPWYATTPQEITEFWETVSKRYADNDTVAFYELYNEPITQTSHLDYSGSSATLGDWLVWRDFMEEIIASIRANDPDKIILIGGLQFAYDLSFVANAPISGSNLAYATHPYSHPKWEKDWKTAFGDLSIQYPVFATEFGYDEGVSPDDEYNGVPYHQAIIEYLEEHRISWTVWVFDASWKPTLLLDNLAYQPSPAGGYFRSIMLNRNQCP